MLISFIGFFILITALFAIANPFGTIWRDLWVSTLVAIIAGSVILKILQPKKKEKISFITKRKQDTEGIFTEKEKQVLPYIKLVAVIIFAAITIMAKPFESIWYNIGFSVLIAIYIEAVT